MSDPQDVPPIRTPVQALRREQLLDALAALLRGTPDLATSHHYIGMTPEELGDAAAAVTQAVLKKGALPDDPPKPRCKCGSYNVRVYCGRFYCRTCFEDWSPEEAAPR